MIKNLLILLMAGALAAGFTFADDHKDQRRDKSEKIKGKSKDGYRDDDAKERWEDEQERRRERDEEARERWEEEQERREDDEEEARERREEERERRRERDEEARERWEEEQERREDEEEEARERWEDEQERKKDKYKDKHKKDKHKHKSKKPDGVHGRDWGAGQGEKRGWSEGKPGSKGDRHEAGKPPYDDDHDHHAHDPAGDEHTPEHGDSDHGATEPQNPEQTLRDMAKDAAARKAGAEKGSATEALIHMGTDMVIDRSTGKGDNAEQ